MSGYWDLQRVQDEAEDSRNRQRADRYRCEDRGQDKRGERRKRHVEKVGVGWECHDSNTIEHGELAHDAQNRLLPGADDMGLGVPRSLEHKEVMSVRRAHVR